jgi:NAD(P)-dependent dehydrogenase (short-subunit alcohol dehydrogenase family)
MDNSAMFATYPSLRNRAVIVTGGASGIGEAIVTAFAVQQAKVAFLDIEDAAAKQLIQRIASSGHPAPTYLHCNLTDIDVLQQAIEKS